MERYSDLREKEVVNIYDGRCLGTICDLCIDLCSGQITAIVLPQCGGRLNAFFRRGEDLIIPWFKVIKIGSDVILVELENDAVHRREGC